MFIRQYFKQENGQLTAYWALVESYRAANGPRQRVVAWLGKLDEAGRLGILRAAEEAKQSAAQHHPHDDHQQPHNHQLQFEFDDAPAPQPRWVEVNVGETDTGGARIEWPKIEAHRDWAALSAGCYLLRTNVANWSDEDLWKAYIQLTEVEAAFRIPKSDLSLRPIWHQKEDRVLAYIFVCFVAYVLWKTLGQICMRAGLGNEPHRVLAELSDIRSMDVVLPTRSGDPDQLHLKTLRPPADPS